MSSIISIKGYNKELCELLYNFIYTEMCNLFVPVHKSEASIKEEIQGIRQQYHFNQYEVFYIYYKNNEMVGTLGLFKVGDNLLRIKRFYIKDGFRHQGIGTELLQTAINYADTHNKEICLTVGNQLTPAISLYEKMGFAVTKEIAMKNELEMYRKGNTEK